MYKDSDALTVYCALGLLQAAIDLYMGSTLPFYRFRYYLSDPTALCRWKRREELSKYVNSCSDEIEWTPGSRLIVLNREQDLLTIQYNAGESARNKFPTVPSQDSIQMVKKWTCPGQKAGFYLLCWLRFCSILPVLWIFFRYDVHSWYWTRLESMGAMLWSCAHSQW